MHQVSIVLIYGVFQLLKSNINSFFGISYQDLRIEISKTKNVGTHKYVIDFYKSEIKHNFDLKTSQSFSRKMRDLKYFREQSDYENVAITKDDSDKAYEKAIDLIEMINKIF